MINHVHIPPATGIVFLDDDCRRGQFSKSIPQEKMMLRTLLSKTNWIIFGHFWNAKLNIQTFDKTNICIRTQMPLFPCLKSRQTPNVQC